MCSMLASCASTDHWRKSSSLLPRTEPGAVIPSTPDATPWSRCSLWTWVPLAPHRLSRTAPASRRSGSTSVLATVLPPLHRPAAHRALHDAPPSTSPLPSSLPAFPSISPMIFLSSLSSEIHYLPPTFTHCPCPSTPLPSNHHPHRPRPQLLPPLVSVSRPLSPVVGGEGSGNWDTVRSPNQP